jgi:putative phage-type endonuclease
MAEIVQGSPEWHALRLGKVTASRIADLMARTKTGWGASRANYAAELVAERLTGVKVEGFKNAAMQWGNEVEGEARAAYAWIRDVDVTEVAFVPHPTIADAGASPDGLVGTHGLVELKCPNTAMHIETLLERSIPGKYQLQMMWQMACTGRDWCDFVSYDPRMPDDMRLFVTRLFRDDAKIAELEREVITFLGEVSETVERLKAAYRVEPNVMMAG